MKKALVSILLLLFNIHLIAQTEIKLSPRLSIKQLSNEVLIVSHYFPWHSNSMIIKASDNDVVLIDTPYTNAATNQILCWIDSVLQPKKITAINTGFHIDNLGGNGALQKKGIDIYGSDLTAKLVDEKGKDTQQQVISWLKPNQHEIRQVYEKKQFTKPNKIFNIEKGKTLELGDLTFEIFYPGESHSPDNVTVYIEELKLLFGGCMIKSLASKTLGFTGDANLKEWPNAVEQLKKKYQSAKLVVPHHGKLGGKNLIDHTLNLCYKKLNSSRNRTDKIRIDQQPDSTK